MWPEPEPQLSDKQLDEFEKSIRAELSEFIVNEKLDSAFLSVCKTVYLPLAKWIDNKHTAEPLVIGINGAQGSGKSTLSQLLVLLLERLFNKTVLHLSIDDLYLSRSQRRELAKTEHPLLNVRGVPGTHNVDLGIKLLSRIKKSSVENLTCPVFDKSIDDLLPEDQWKPIQKNIDIVLFEGWCVAAQPQSEDALKKPLNLLESLADADAAWRAYVNQQLAGKYAKLFSYIDHLIMLKVPDMESIFEWRTLQENKLKDKSKKNNRVMSQKEIKEFIMYFERVTRHCLSEMPKRADVVLSLNRAHQITSVELL